MRRPKLGNLTVPVAATNNCREVLTRTTHPVASALAILAVLAYGVLPAEHVHESRAHDAHHSEVIHRHFAPHHQSVPDTLVSQDDDDHVQWLTTAFTASKTTAHVRPGFFAIALVMATSSADRVSEGAVPALFVSVHDPPWTTASGLRGPPASRL